MQQAQCRFSSARLQLRLLQLEAQAQAGRGEAALQEVVVLRDACRALHETGAPGDDPQLLQQWSWRSARAVRVDNRQVRTQDGTAQRLRHKASTRNSSGRRACAG